MSTATIERGQKIAYRDGGSLILGHYPEFADDPLAMLKRLAREGQAISRVRFATDDIYTLNSPAVIKHVMQLNYKKYAREERVGEAVRLIAGENLFTSDGDVWLRQRRLMQPAFHRQRIGRFADEIVNEVLVEMAHWPAEQASTGYVDLEEAMTRLTSQVIGRAMLSVDLRAEGGDLGDAFATVAKFSIDRIMSPIRLPLWVPSANNRTFKDAVLRIKRALSRILAERQNATTEAEPAGDLLDMLLEAKYEETGTGMTTAQLISEMNSIVFAGHETTAATLDFAFFLLMTHPEVMAAVQAEIDAVLAGRLPTLADLSELDLTGRVMLETLRMYPAAISASRNVIEDDVVDGVEIPAGSKVMLNIYGVHYHPDYWAEPERFNPDRFLPENSEGRPPLAFIPFNTGPRKCIGDEFARMEAHLALATVLQRYTPVLKPGHLVKPAFKFVLKPTDGLPVTLIERSTP